MGQLFNRASRQLGRIGIVPSLLCVSLLAVLIAAVVVQGWTLNIVRQAEQNSAQSRLDVDLAVLTDALKQRGTAWRLADDGRLTLDGKPVQGLDTVVNDINRLTHAVATVFAGDSRIATTVKRPDGSPAVGTKLAAGPAREAVIDHGLTYRGMADILGVPHFVLYEPLRDPTGHQVGILFVGVSYADVQAIFVKIIWNASLAALAVILVIGVSLWFMLRGMLRPLKTLAGAVHAIGEGHLEVAIPYASRNDQLGEIGSAVERLREKARQARAFETKAAVDQQAKARQRQAMDRLTQDFATSVSGVLSGLITSAESMRGSAADMAHAAGQTRHDMASTASDADLSSQNLSRAAAAAEQLTASIEDISRQVDQATQAAQEAVEQARATDATVQGLGEAAGQIGQVVSLISSIASQTNLLALNATIEAARAGEAGKGFAVVAGEVKQLAAQTAQATRQIGGQVSAIQAATVEAASAVMGMTAAIARVSDVATTITASVGQQSAATHEIAEQVNMVAGATGKATRAMLDVSDVAIRSEQTSQIVLGSANEVTQVSGTLRAEVDYFVAAMRRSQDSGDRRKYERIAGGHAKVNLQSTAHGIAQTTIIDISLGGAALSCDWLCPVGTEMTLGLPGDSAEVFLRVVRVHDGVLHVAFRQDPETLRHVERAIDWILAQAANSLQGKAA